ncbi:cytokine receptor-like factor 1 [Amphiura filiformis]|uniref:cytokine receptor-like factor 1 n=1 Tax=Amphiura filiformis TaxID=82378 RepID=UPI003B212CBC
MNTMMRSVLVSAVIISVLVSFINTQSINTNATVTISPNTTVVVPVGTHVEFNCSIDGPKTTINWYKGATPLPSRSMRRLEDGTIQLVFSEVQVEDGQPGYYTCCVVLEDGRCHSETEVHIHLKVGYPPDPAKNLECYSHDMYYGHCKWDKPDRDSHLETSYTLQLKTGRDKWDSVKCSNKTVSDSSCTWQTDDKYHVYRVLTCNDLGKNATSPSDAFHSLHAAVPYPPNEVRFGSPTSKSVRVKWDKIKKFDYYNVDYKVRYNTNFNQEWTEVQIEYGTHKK